MDVLETPRAQCLGNDDTTRSVHGRIDDVEVFLAQDDILVDHRLLDSLQIVPVHLATDNLDEVVVGLELHILDLHLVHLVDDALVVRREHLGAVVPIGLVAVILAGVVRGGDVDTSLTAQLTDGKRDLRRGTQALEEICLDAVGREDGCNGLCKHTAVVAVVVTYYDSEVVTSGECLQDIVGKTLGGHTNDILVHAVGAGTHDATQTARTELEVLIEGVDERCLVGIVQHCLYFLTCLLVKGRRKPFLSPCLALSNQLSIIFHKNSCLF